MIACDQNAVIGKLVYARDSIEVWKTPSSHHKNEGWIGIFNRSDESRNFSISLSDMGLQPYVLFDIWNHRSLGKTRAVNAMINAHGVLFCKYQ